MILKKIYHASLLVPKENLARENWRNICLTHSVNVAKSMLHGEEHIFHTFPERKLLAHGKG